MQINYTCATQSAIKHEKQKGMKLKAGNWNKICKIQKALWNKGDIVLQYNIPSLCCSLASQERMINMHIIM